MGSALARRTARFRASLWASDGTLKKRSRLGISLLVSVLYIASIPVTLGLFGSEALDLVALPIAAVAALHGLRSGFAACAIGVAFNASVAVGIDRPIESALGLAHVLALAGPCFSFGLMHRYLYRSKAQAHDLRRSRAALQQVVENAPLILNAFDVEGRFTLREGRALAAIGELHGEHLGYSARAHFRTAYPDQPQLVEFLDRALAGREASGDVTIRGRTEDVHFRPIRDAAGAVTGAVCVALDVTEERAARSALLHRATHDSLTDLPNQTMLTERLTDEIRRCEQTGAPFALIVVGLDNFRDVNGTFGYSAGDTVLREVALRLLHEIEPNDLVARLGGDQFALLFRGLNEQLGVEAATRLLACFSRPLDIGGHPIDLSASVGVALFPGHGSESKTLIRCADTAMHVAKRTRRSFALYAPQRDEPDPDSVQLVGDLRVAIDRGGIDLAFQPEVRIADHGLVRVEALARWTHAELGPISPARFVALAERTGLIGALTRRMVTGALRQSRIWREHGLDTIVAVNVSPNDLADPHLAAFIEEELALQRLPPSALALEITEGALMTDVTAVAPRIAAFRALGVSVEIDDFGTGYSSLAYLSRLPVDGVKIDRSFIQRITTDAGSRAIVRAAVQLGHELGLRVVAEGVETAAEWNEVVALGCDTVQGYFISRPMSGAGIEAWAKNAGRTTVRTTPGFSPAAIN